MNEQITEESLYQVDDQEGYNLISIIVAHMKKSPAPTKKPAPQARKIVAAAKKMIVPPKQHQIPLQPSNHDPIQLKATPQEVRTSDKLSYAFNLESKIQKLKIPFPLIELMNNEAFKASILNPFSQGLP